MRWPRMRVRTLMIAVVLAAIVLMGYVLRERRSRYLQRAGAHAQAEFLAHVVHTSFKPHVSLEERRRISRAMNSPAKADYHSPLKEKYEHAARYPWLPVPPDP